MSSAPPQAPLLAASGVRLSLGGHPILQGIDLKAEAGEITALLGPNGAGKSTLIRVLAGLHKADAGEVRIRDRALADYDARALGRRLALVPQDTTVEADFPVADFVAMGRYPHLGRFGLPGAEDKDAVREAMVATDIGELADRLMPTLSGGERQRVFLARAWATRGQLVLLDEPTANLDVRHALEFHNALDRLVHGAESRGAIVAMHELNAALRYADRVVVLNHGQVVGAGAPTQVLTDDCLREVFGVRAERLSGPDGQQQLALSLLAPQ